MSQCIISPGSLHPCIIAQELKSQVAASDWLGSGPQRPRLTPLGWREALPVQLRFPTKIYAIKDSTNVEITYRCWVDSQRSKRAFSIESSVPSKHRKHTWEASEAHLGRRCSLGRQACSQPQVVWDVEGSFLGSGRNDLTFVSFSTWRGRSGKYPVGSTVSLLFRSSCDATLLLRRTYVSAREDSLF